jgi:hypothetical protein
MTRSDLVEELAAKFVQLTHQDAEFAVKAILDAMNDALVRGQRIEIRFDEIAGRDFSHAPRVRAAAAATRLPICDKNSVPMPE